MSGFEETKSREITLKDEPDFINAIDCMIAYFYEADYNASKFGASVALLHAQVAIVADKYDCGALLKLARKSFDTAIETIGIDEWSYVTAFVYEHTSTASPVHVDIRKTALERVASRDLVLRTALRTEKVVDMLRSNADLATDFALSGQQGPKARTSESCFFRCVYCDYIHSGSKDCSMVSFMNSEGPKKCPQCKGVDENDDSVETAYRFCALYSCSSCGGSHTIDNQA